MRKPGKPDTAWFHERLRDAGYASWYELAPEMRRRDGGVIDRSAVTRMITGKRGVDIFEAAQLARLLRVELLEVIRRLGV
jgi:hypothetical protein